METRRRASAGQEVEGERPPDEVVAARSGSSTRRGERTRCFPPAGLLENRHLAARGKQEVTIPLCRPPRPSGPSRLLAGGTASGRMAIDRMVGGSAGTGKILAVDTPRGYSSG